MSALLDTYIYHKVGEPAAERPHNNKRAVRRRHVCLDSFGVQLLANQKTLQYQNTVLGYTPAECIR